MQVKLDQINSTIEGFNEFFNEGKKQTMTEEEAQKISKSKVGMKARQSLIAVCTFKRLIISYEKSGDKVFKLV